MQKYKRLRNGYIVEISAPVLRLLEQAEAQTNLDADEIIEAGIRLYAAYAAAKSRAQTHTPKPKPGPLQGALKHAQEKASMARKKR